MCQMPQKSKDSVHILEGRATLYKRELTPHWQVRYKVYGKWLRQTTKTDDLKEAKTIAVDIVTNAWFSEKNHLPVISKRFKSVAKLAIDRMQDLMAAGQGKSTYKTYIQALSGYLIPFLGSHNIDRIDNVLINQFSKWRIEQMGRTPNASTLNNHNSALNRVFDEAIERGYMTRLQVPLLRNDGIKTQRRPDFTAEEYATLYRAMRPWVKNARKGNEALLRGVLRDYVLVLANTGIRAGTEAMNLTWSNITFFDESGKRYLALHVNGKTGHREVIARHCVARYLDRLRKLTTTHKAGTFEAFLKKKLNQPVFRVGDKDTTSTFGKMFARLLTQTQLLKDYRTNTVRTLYSLRHTYATFALTYNRMNVYTLAEHMGTSVKMIEDHYGHLQLRKKAHEIAGDRQFGEWGFRR